MTHLRGGISGIGMREPHSYPNDQLTVAGLVARLVELSPDRPVFVGTGPSRRAVSEVVETQSLDKGSAGVVEVEIR